MTDILVCGPISYYHDDVEILCSRCRCKSYHRPHSPPNTIKICLDCFVKDEHINGKPLTITPQTRKEIAVRFINNLIFNRHNN